MRSNIFPTLAAETERLKKSLPHEYRLLVLDAIHKHQQVIALLTKTIEKAASRV